MFLRVAQYSQYQNSNVHTTARYWHCQTTKNTQYDGHSQYQTREILHWPLLMPALLTLCEILSANMREVLVWGKNRRITHRRLLQTGALAAPGGAMVVIGGITLFSENKAAWRGGENYRTKCHRSRWLIGLDGRRDY